MKKQSTAQDIEEQAVRSLVTAFVGIVCPDLIKEKLRIDRARQRAAKKKRDRHLPKKVDLAKRQRCELELHALLQDGPKPVVDILELMKTAGFTKRDFNNAVIAIRAKRKQHTRPGPVLLSLPEVTVDRRLLTKDERKMDRDTSPNSE